MPLPDGAPRIFLQLVDGASAGTEDPMVRFTDRLMQFEFSDHEAKRDELTLSLRNDDFTLLDDPVFRRGQKILVSWGWPGAMGVPRRMIVVDVRGGNPLIVKAHDPTLLLDRVRRSRVWTDTTDSAVVRAIAAEHGYEGTLVSIEETDAVWPSVVQPGNMTDAGMLQRLARRNGFISYLDATGLHWHRRPHEAEPQHTFIYRADPGVGSILDEPAIEANLSKGVALVRVLARDPATKELIDAVVSASNADLVSLGQADELADPQATDAADPVAARITGEERVHAGYLPRTAAEALAQARYRETASGRYKLRCKVVGDATIAAKQVVEIYGLSATTDGLYYVKEATHHIAGGEYVVDLQCQKDAQREVKLAATFRNRVNAWARLAQPRAADPTLGRVLEVRLGPNEEVIPTWVYVVRGQEFTADLSEAEIYALSERELAFLTRVGAQTQLPDA